MYQMSKEYGSSWCEMCVTIFSLVFVQTLLTWAILGKPDVLFFDQVRSIVVVIMAVARGDLTQKIEIQGRRDVDLER
jgi:hypothetical protein